MKESQITFMRTHVHLARKYLQVYFHECHSCLWWAIFDYGCHLCRLEGSGKQHDIIGRRREPALTNLQQRSNSLKAILGRIPAEISDRKKFLDTIK